jgi:pimeloyl-ACP methyl ester carboxylesterase
VDKGELPEQVAVTIEHILFGTDWSGATAWKEKWRAMTAANLSGSLDTLASRDDISARISSIDVPTLIVHGDSDAAIPLAKARAMKETIPNSELVVIPGGHSVNMTNPGPVNAALNDFFEQHQLVS